MQHLTSKVIFLFLVFLQMVGSVNSADPILFSVEEPVDQEGIVVNFKEVSALEFLHFIGKVAGVNFIYNEALLDFKVSLVTGRPTTPIRVLSIFFTLLKSQGIKAEEYKGCYLVQPMTPWEIEQFKREQIVAKRQHGFSQEGVVDSSRRSWGRDRTLTPQEAPYSGQSGGSRTEVVRGDQLKPDTYFDQVGEVIKDGRVEEKLRELGVESSHHAGATDPEDTRLDRLDFSHVPPQTTPPPYWREPFIRDPFCPSNILPCGGLFHRYKLQYHPGEEIQSVIKNLALQSTHSYPIPSDLLASIHSMQWIESTNSLVYSGSSEGIGALSELIQTLDVPKKQVLIEVLVIETSAKNGLDFGLDWSASGEIDNQLKFAMGTFPDREGALDKRKGTIPHGLGRGFDLSVIGDIIFHKGRDFVSLNSLVSALEVEEDTTIVLNEKLIAQDNKLSRIFSGDNVPFQGSTVTNEGANTLTTVNLEYRDVGVTLEIIPLIGEGDIVTLDISEKISEVIEAASSQSGGIRTTKTDMATQAHVPDQSFLILSGVVRRTQSEAARKVPCLGGIPWLGSALFSRQVKVRGKRNVIIFVRPQIIHSSNDEQRVSEEALTSVRKRLTAGDQRQVVESEIKEFVHR